MVNIVIVPLVAGIELFAEPIGVEVVSSLEYGAFEFVVSVGGYGVPCLQ